MREQKDSSKFVTSQNENVHQGRAAELMVERPKLQRAVHDSSPMGTENEQNTNLKQQRKD